MQAAIIICYVEAVLRLKWHPETVHVCVNNMSVCAGVYERRKRVWPEAFSASWLEADGRVGMVNQAQQREEGVVFFTQAVVSGSGVRKGQGSVPRCSVPLLFIPLCFISYPLHNTQSSWGRHSVLGQTSMPRPSVWTLLPFRNASTSRVI